MRRLTALGLVLAASAAFAPAAGAAPSLSSTGDANFPDRSFILTLPPGTQARAGQVAVTENGAPVDDLKVEPVDAARRKRLGVVLVLDTSRSMSGDPLSQAFAAARAFASERNKSQPLALVTFNSSSQVAMPLTTDPFEIQESLARPPETRPQTHLYDASLQAVDVIREANLPGGFVVVLSDGADFGSEASRGEVATAARDAHVRMYTVGLSSPKFDPNALEALASSAGGTYSEAGSASELSAIYSELSAELSNAYVLTYHSVVRPRVKVDVSANVRGVGTAGSTYTSPRLAVGSRGSDDDTWSSPIAVALAVFVIASLLGLAIMNVLRRRRQTPRERVEQFVNSAAAEPGPDDSLTDRLASTTERSLSGSARWERFSEAVDIAGFQLSAARLLTNSLALAGAVGFLLAVATGQIVLILLAVAATPFVLSSVVRARAAKQRRAFADQLADHLAVVGASLRAGHSFPAALAAGLEDAPEPAAREFERVLADEHLGAPLDEALEELARRMNSRDVEQVALLALLQREAGADAAEMLDGVVQSIRERQQLRRTVRTLTAQGRFSRTILTALPIGSLVFLMVTNRDYLDPLFNTGTGQALMAVGVAMLAAGSLVIKRIVDFDI